MFNLLLSLCTVCLTAVKDHEAQDDGEGGTHFCSSVFFLPFLIIPRFTHTLARLRCVPLAWLCSAAVCVSSICT